MLAPPSTVTRPESAESHTALMALGEVANGNAPAGELKAEAESRVRIWSAPVQLLNGWKTKFVPATTSPSKPWVADAGVAASTAASSAATPALSRPREDVS